MFTHFFFFFCSPYLAINFMLLHAKWIKSFRKQFFALLCVLYSDILYPNLFPFLQVLFVIPLMSQGQQCEKYLQEIIIRLLEMWTLLLGKIEGRRRMGWQRVRGLDGIIDTIDLSLSKLWEIVKDREAWHAAVCMVAKSQTWLSNSTTTTIRNAVSWIKIRLPFKYADAHKCCLF